MDHSSQPLPSGIFWSSRVVATLGILAILQIVIQEIRAMRNTPNLSFVVAATAFLHHSNAASQVDLAWYPPNATKINNLTSALDSIGIYGFIYNNSYPEDVSYGTYNWCNMPHVRRQEYKQPSSVYKLTYVELIHRHHKRTVYASNSFPVESYGWSCDDEGLYYYGQPAAGNRSAHTYWQITNSSINPFKPSGFVGSCQFPQITKGGLDDSFQHGKDLYGVYHELLNFIPNNPKNKVSFRVTQNQITSQVAGMLINGMFGSQDDIPLTVQASGIDSLEPTYNCATSTSLYNNQRTLTNWTEHLIAAAPLYATLDNISGVSPTDQGFHASFDHYYDNLSARQCHAKPFPCKLVGGVNSSTCINQRTADAVYRMGHWEYSYIYRDSPMSLNAAVGSFGVWIAELAANIRAVIAGKSDTIYRHNIAHDGSISRLLSFLQIEVMLWPGMGSEVVFEVYKKESPHRRDTSDVATGSSKSNTSSYYLRALYGGEVLRSSSPTLGLMDMISLETVLAYFDGLLGVNASLVAGKCDGTIPL